MPMTVTRARKLFRDFGRLVKASQLDDATFRQIIDQNFLGQGHPLMKEMQAVVGGRDAAMARIDDEAGEYGLVVLWASKEDAEVAAKLMGPRLRSALEGVATEPPTIRLMEVYKPAA